MIDFSNYIAERTQAVTGRRWVFEAINAWPDDDTSRDFLLTGGPGSGKSAIAGRLAPFKVSMKHDLSGGMRYSRCSAKGGKLLVRLDDGQTVSQVYEAILDVESWWTRPEGARPTASV